MSKFIATGKTVFSPGMQSIIAILTLWLLSVGVRAPNLDDPLGRKFEILTAHTLITLNIWQEKSPAAYHFSPIYTFDYEANRHIKSLTSGMPDKQGNYYYVSYPPFAFIFPFYVFKALFITPSVFALRMLNLLLHLVCAFGLYRLVLAIYEKHVDEGISLTALTASAVYLFSPGTLWYHSNVYFVDILVQPLWILCILIAFKTLQENSSRNPRSLIWLGAITFFTVYTEWLGLLFAFILSLIALSRVRSDRFYLSIFLMVAGSSMIAIALTLLQYASINDLNIFLESSTSRYIERSGYNGRLGWFFEWRGHLMIFTNYLRMYFPVLAIMFFLATAYVLGKKQKETGKIIQNERMALMLCVLPVLLHHFVFFDFTVMHEFSILKSSVPISVGIAILLNKNLNAQNTRSIVFFKKLSLSILTILLLHSVYVYYTTYIPIDRFVQKDFSKVVNQTSEPDETIFIQTKTSILNFVYKTYSDVAVDAQLQYYTKRNIAVSQSKEDAYRFLIENDIDKGILYQISSKGDLISFEKIAIDQE